MSSVEPTIERGGQPKEFLKISPGLLIFSRGLE
jgi:hypothetical protein